MPTLYDKQTGEAKEVPNEQIGQALQSGRFGAQSGQRFNVLDADGNPYSVPVEQLQESLGGGFRLATDDEVHAAKVQEKYGDTAGELAATAAGAARGLSFGLSDHVLTESGFVDKETLAGLKEANPTASIVGEVAGVAAPLVFSGGATALGTGARVAGAGVRGVARAGTAAERATAAALRGSEAGIARELLAQGAGKAVGGALEGAVYGGGQIVSEMALGEPEEVAENALAHLGMSMLLGGVGGAAIGGTGALGAAALKKGVAKGVAAAEKAGIVTDGKEILSKFAAQRVTKGSYATRSKIEKVDDGAVGEHMLRNYDELGGKNVIDPRGSVKKTLDNIETVRESAGKRIGSALDELDAAAGGPVVNGARVARRIEEELIEPISKQVGYKPVARMLREFAEQAEEAGEMTLREANLQKSRIQDLLDYDLSGRAAKSVPNAYKKKAASLFREEVDAMAEEVSRAAGKPELAANFLDAKRTFAVMSDAQKLYSQGASRIANNAAVPLYSMMLGAAGFAAGVPLEAAGIALASKFARERGNLLLARVADKASRIEGLSKVMKDTEKTIAKAADSIVSGAARAAKLGPPAAVSLTDTLGLKAKDDEEAYTELHDKLSVLLSDPELMTDRVGNMTAPIVDAAPEAARALAARSMQGAAFLHKRMVKPPPPVGPFAAEVKWTPPKAEVRKLAAYVKAITEPLSILDDTAKGIPSAEGVEVLREVYPTLYAKSLRAIEDAADARGEAMSYDSLTSLSVLYGRPLHPTMDPGYIQTMEGLEGSPPPPPPTDEPAPKSRGAFSKDLDLDSSRATEAERILQSEG